MKALTDHAIKDHAQPAADVAAADAQTIADWHHFQHKHAVAARLKHAHDEFTAKRLDVPIVDVEP